GKKIALQPAEITNDLDVAARLGNAEEQAQLRIREAALAAAATPKPATPVPVAVPATPVPVQPTATPPRLASAATPQPPGKPRSSVENLFEMPNPDGTPPPPPGRPLADTITEGGWVWEKAPDGRWKRFRPVR